MANRRNLAIVEDALKVIFSVGEWDSRARTVTDIATHLGVSTSAASTLVRRLSDDGLVDHERYGAVALTSEGLRRALAVVRRHRLIETFLVDVLAYSWDQVHDEAEVLEHAISDFMLERIDTLLGAPWRDPHGDAIPTVDGVIHRSVAAPLESLEIAATGYVVRLLDRSPAMLRWFLEHDMGLDAPISVVERKPFAGAVVVEVGAEGSRRRVDVGLEAVAAVWVGADLPSAEPSPAGCRYPRCHHEVVP